ncbi:uncharacterized protein LOC107863312 [Capsicum annuum]|uniref:uncharacterized protein LOC107863312 n=1 Tax=Capsicum annuum TaxID=4072 RepID=UPI001FB1555F|nr:uncharacterized protein LOC107863312 [Capsicum annuum]
MVVCLIPYKKDASPIQFGSYFFSNRLKLETHVKGYVRISWMYWFKKILYHQVGLVYVLTKLVTNVSQAFLDFYVINDLQMRLSSKALPIEARSTNKSDNC